MISVPSYYRKAFDPNTFQSTVKVLVEKVTEMVAKDPQIKAIAASGNSGVPVAAAAAFASGLALTVVRKKNEPLTHSATRVTGYIGPGKYIIVDDLISSGATMRHVVTSIDEFRSEEVPSGAGYLEPAAIVLYSDFWRYEMPFKLTERIEIPVVNITRDCREPESK